MTGNQKTRCLIGVAIGVAGLLFSRHYSGSGAELIHSHGANVTFSFGAYYMLRLCRLPRIEIRRVNAAYALFGVSAQEAAQALGLYPGTFDPIDFAANTAGIAIAWAVDAWVSKRFATMADQEAS
ncbi:MAG: hypothetical protein HOC74_00465 [Gemmatimonadetes bacterium]|nr:hypothetical protein [Gemmatimonadota bacterium]